MDRSERQQLLERFVIALIESTHPLQQAGSADPEVNLELLIEAANQLKLHLERELGELRAEQAE
jgi:ribosomal protein S15P/S13E